MTVPAGSARSAPVIDTALLAAAAAAELEDWGPLEEATSADTPMQVHGLTMWTGPEGSGQETGIWQCSAGPSYWVQEENEFIYLLSGSLTVTPDGGTPLTIGPGDCALFPRGWRGAWELHETVRKVYVVF
jgi:uncharacterized protein